MMRSLRRAASALGLVALAVWLGGLVALGVLAAPVVFTVVPLPKSADAMTIVFTRFDWVAMGCAAVAVATEAVRAVPPLPFASLERARTGLTGLVAALAVLEGVEISPRIARLHAGGVLRGAGDPARDLARLHDLAESCGKAEVVLLVAILVLHAITPEPGPLRSRETSEVGGPR